MTESDKHAQTPDDDGYFPIHRSVIDRSAPELRRLISGGADINAKTRQGRTALHLACIGGDHQLAKLLITKSANVHAADNAGRCAMHMAALSCNGAIRLLADAGAPVDVLDDDGQTPLMLACRKGRVGAAKSLLSLGAETQVNRFSDNSLVWLAVDALSKSFPPSALQMMTLLIKAGAGVGCRNAKNGETELHLIADRIRNGGLATAKYLELINLLIRAGANPWEKNHLGESTISIIGDEGINQLHATLKSYLVGRERDMVSGITTVSELRAFMMCQTRLAHRDLLELLPAGTAAKTHFAEISTQCSDDRD